MNQSYSFLGRADAAWCAAFHQRHRISLEVLANLAQLPTTGAWVLVGGPINRHGAGSTSTIWAVIPPGC